MKAIFLAAALLAVGAASARADVTVLGWPGGPEEVALRATVEDYNKLPSVAADDKVSTVTAEETVTVMSE